MSTIFSTKDVDSLCRALVKQYNALHDALAVSDGYSSNHFHRDVSGVPSGDFSNPSSTAMAVSSNLATSPSTLITLVNDLLGVCQAHFADDCAHLEADSVNGATLAALAPATTQAGAITLVTQVRDAYEAHRVNTSCHIAADTESKWTGAAATDLSSAESLANFGKPTVNDHILSAPTVGRIKLV